MQTNMSKIIPYENKPNKSLRNVLVISEMFSSQKLLFSFSIARFKCKTHTSFCNFEDDFPQNFRSPLSSLPHKTG